MTTNLLSTDTGRQTLARIACYLGRDRMSKHFERSFYRAFDAWRTAEALTPGSGYFDLETLLNDLNGATQDEIAYINTLLGRLGCLEGQSVADTTIYVDPTNGSDVTGDGSASKPYESLSFLTSGRFPKRIDHAYSIAFLSDCDVGGDLIIDSEFGPNGSLSLVGVGEPTVVAGPFEIDAAGTGVLDDDVGRYFKMTGAVGADPSGQFLMAVDGQDEGYAQAIHSLAAADTLLTVSGSFLNIKAGDHVSVVRPPVTLTVGEIAFQCRNTNGYTSLSKIGAKVAVYNLRIAITNLVANAKEDCVLIDNACVQQMSFVQIVPPSSGSMRVTQKAELNTLCGPSDAATLAATTVTNLNEYIQFFDIAGLVIDESAGSLSLNVEGTAKYVSGRTTFYMWKTGILEEVTCNRIVSRNCIGKILVAMTEGRANSGAGGGLEAENSSLDVDTFTALNSDNVISVLANSSLSVEKAGADSTYSTVTGFGVYCSGVARVELRDASARLIGATSPYGVKLDTVASPVTSAIPAAYAWTSDSTGTFVKRLAV